MRTVHRRQFLIAAGVLLAVPLARAQAPERMRRVAWLTGGSPKSHVKLLQAFRDGMREFGWVEGRNLALELRWAEGQSDRLPALAAELARLNPEVIVSAATAVLLVLKKETSSIPIVMATGADPVGAGLAASLARPGGNVTGLTSFYETTPMKMLELAASMAPRGARVSALVDVNTPFSSTSYRAKIEHTAKALGQRAEFIEASAPQDASRVLEALRKNSPATLIVLPSPMFFALGSELVTRAEALKIPVIYPFEELVEVGGFMSYATPVADNYRRAAFFVDRILRGTKPGDLPIEQPTRLTLAINLKVAKAHGIKIPQSILLRADRVIE
jgi:putative ABC transport system substrate-binding protein